MMKRFLAALLGLVLSASAAFAQIPGNFNAGTVYGNSSAAARPGRVETLNAILNRALCSTQGAIPSVVTTAWACVTPGTAGLPLLSGGAGANVAYGVLTNAGLATMANATFKCRFTAGTGAPEDCTATQSTSLLNAFVGDSGSGGTKGLVPAPAAGDAAAVKFLKADGTWSATGAGVTSVVCNGLTITSTGTCPEPFEIKNCTLAASVAANILTVALKDGAGSDASATSVCRIAFRSPTATTGSTVYQSVTAALSITTNATGATLGSSNSTAFRFWVIAFDNGGTVVLALYNASTATSCSPINEGAVQSSTAISGSATSAGVYYTPNGTTVSAKSIKILGYVEYNSTGLGTAGTYASGPNFIETFGPGIKKPCEVMQTAMATSAQVVQSSSSYATGPTTTPALTSASNLIHIRTNGGAVLAAGLNSGFVSIFRGTTGGTQLFSHILNNSGAAIIGASVSLTYLDKPNVSGNQQYTIGVRGDGTNSVTFGRGDVNNNSLIIVSEIQG